MNRRWVHALCVAGLVVAYGYRAALGVNAGFSMLGGQSAVDEDEREIAADLFADGAVGSDRFRATRKSADELLARWNEQEYEEGTAAADPTLLELAAERYITCLLLSPASPRPWSGLGRVYDRREAARRARLPDLDPATGPVGWPAVGHPGRVAVGMLRRATERAPNWYSNYDRLSLTLWDYGAREEALEAVRTSARVLPLLSRHDRYTRGEGIPAPMLEAFSQGAWSALGRTRFLSARAHLVALGRLELRRGALGRALTALEAAAERPGDALNRAEIDFLLGVVLVAAGRDERALPHLERASRSRTFRGPALVNRSRIAERAGRAEEAYELLSRARWEHPDNLEYCLEFARLALRQEKWQAAIETLRWARQVDDEDRRPVEALVEALAASGDVAGARTVIALADPEVIEELDPDRLRAIVDRYSR